MEQTRTQKHQELEQEIGRTPLVKYNGNIPNGNQIYIKRECDNPFGSHYDRVYSALFKHYEEQGKISPGAKVLETSSGSAGVSFAGIGRKLGFDCYVALPAGGEKAREIALLEQLPNEDHLIFTPAEEYVNGFPKFLKKFLAEHKDYFFLNHSMGPRDKSTGRPTNNEVTLRALEGIAKESLDETDIDYFIPAMGNGSSVLGPGRAFNEGAKVIPFETVQSAVAFDLMHPGEYERIFGIKPGTLSRHRLPGTSYQGIDFPHVRNSVETGLIDDVALISDARMDEEYEKITGKQETRRLPHWDAQLEKCDDLGRSTRAGIATALDIAKNVKGKSLLVIGYDKAERYDS